VDFDPVRESDIIRITAKSKSARESALLANVFAESYRDRNIYMSRAKSRSFREFLEARKVLLAAELNRRMEDLLHGDNRWLAGPSAVVSTATAVSGGITSEEEEKQLEALNDWMEAQGLPRGLLAYDFADSATGEQKAVFDLAWPSGIQEELSQPVAVLLNESAETIGIASQAGYRCFTTSDEFRRYVSSEILAGEPK
jgi:hypothetical protein